MKIKKQFTYFVLLYMLFINNSTIIYASETNLNIDKVITKSTESNETSTTSETEKTSNSENSNQQETNQTENQQENIEDPLNLVAESAILIDAKTGVILYEKDCHKKLYPASITKIMTTLLAIEYGKYDDIITHSHNAIYGIGPGSSHIGMREGEQITFDQALYGIMLESANEVCMAVAEHIDGTVDKFVEKMNKKAKEVGAEDTHFANPHGFHDDNHYTTSYDMAQIMKAAIKEEKFVSIISTVSTSIPPTNIVNEIRYLNNKNKMIQPWSAYYYENCVGSKTGFTDEAGNTLVTYGKKGNIDLISVVMKDKGTSIYTDTKTLLEYGFEQYENKELFNIKDYSGSISAIQKYKDKTIELGNVELRAENSIDGLFPKILNKTSVKTEINIPENIEAPIKIGDKIGTLDLKFDNQIVGSINLLSEASIDAIPEEELIKQEKKELFINKVIFILKIIGISIVSIIVLLFAISFIIRKSNSNKRRKNSIRRKQRYRVKAK